VDDAWARGQKLSVHGWIYSLLDGRVRELGMGISSKEQLASDYESALKRLDEKKISA